MLRTNEIPLQYNLFSGELVDNRTAEQKRRDNQADIPTQLLMFSQRDIAQIGVHPNPRMDLSPGKLRLISEDPRTEEEIEQDRLREAERLTLGLFDAPHVVAEPPQVSPEPSLPAEIPTYLSPPTSEITEDEEEEAAPEPLPPLEPPLSKWAAYQQLVAAAEEQAGTVSASPPVRIAQRISLSVAQFEAKRAGLNETEIATALMLGEYRVQYSPTFSVVKPETKVADSEPVQAADPKADEPEIPILWLYRADLVKRRPDLAVEIKALGDHEIEALAALVGEALEEFYWIQLNVVLSLVLDHDLKLALHVPRNRSKTQ